MNWQPWPSEFDAHLTQINTYWENRLYDVISGYAELRNPWAWMLVTCSGVAALFLTAFLFLTSLTFSPDVTIAETEKTELEAEDNNAENQPKPLLDNNSTFAWSSPEQNEGGEIISLNLGPAEAPEKPQTETQFTDWPAEPKEPQTVPDPFEFPIAADVPERRPALEVVIQRTELLPSFDFSEAVVSVEGIGQQPGGSQSFEMVNLQADPGWIAAATSLFEKPFVPVPNKQTFLAFEGDMNQLSGAELFPLTESDSSQLVVTRTDPESFAEGQVQRYRLEITNQGQSPFVDLRLIEAIPAGMEVLQASPSPRQHQQMFVWDIAEIAPGTTQAIEVDVLAHQSSMGLFQTTTMTQLAAARNVDVVPLVASLEVPQQIQFEVETFERVVMTVANRGEVPITNPHLVIDLPAHVHHKVGPKMTRSVPPLAPGESREVSVTFAGIDAGEGKIRVQLVDHQQVLASRQIQAATRFKTTVRKQWVPKTAPKPTTKEMVAECCSDLDW